MPKADVIAHQGRGNPSPHKVMRIGEGGEEPEPHGPLLWI